MSPTCMGNCCVNPDWINNPTSSANWSNSMNIPLSDKEKDVLSKLCSAWVAFNEFYDSSKDDVNEFRDAIHRCQQIIALRVARRANPEVWIQP